MKLPVYGLLLAVAAVAPVLAQDNGYWRQQQDLPQMRAYQAQEAERLYRQQVLDLMRQQQQMEEIRQQ
jgi:hypothetical protein